MSCKKPTRSFDRSCDDLFDLQTLLHPAGAFAQPAHVVRDPDLAQRKARHPGIVDVGCRQRRRNAKENVKEE